MSTSRDWGASPHVRMRVSVGLLSVMYGALVGGWSARVPEIREQVGADQRTWGLVNGAEVAAGLIVAVAMVGLVSRLDARRLALISAAGMLLDAPLMASSTTLAMLVAGAVVWGVVGNLFEVPVQALQLGVQEAYGRPLIGTFSACWSIGSFIGAGLGVLASAVGVSPGTELGLISLVLAACLLFAGRWAPSSVRPVVRPASLSSRIRNRLTPQLLLLVAISFLTAYTSSAGEQWSAIYTSQTLKAGATLGAVTYTAWVLASAVGLLIVDRLITRIGLVRFFRISMVLAAAGLGLNLLAGTSMTAITGFALLGLCSAGTAPLLNGLGGRQPGLTPGEGLSVVNLGQPPGVPHITDPDRRRRQRTGSAGGTGHGRGGDPGCGHAVVRGGRPSRRGLTGAGPRRPMRQWA